MSTTYAVVMAGGSGTRFWPMSRARRPKQLLPLTGDRSLVRQTVERLFPLFDARRVWVVCGREHADAIRRDLEILPGEQVVDEPVGRDTAAAVGLAAMLLEWRNPGATIVTLSADHYIGDVAKFHAAIGRAVALAQDGSLVTFGVAPTRPATGFGYLEVDGERVVGYREKPDLAKAKEFLASGRHLWNSGMFVWKASAIIAQIKEHLPEHHRILSGLRDSLGGSAFGPLLDREYPKIPRISIDHGVMEKAAGVKVVRADFGWDDVGSWTAAASHRRMDADGNVVEGLSVGVDTKDSIVFSTDDKHLVATLGLRDIVIVHTKDATLVCPKDRVEEIKQLVDRIREKKLEDKL